MSGTQRNQRKAQQSWGPLTNHPMSLASSTLCGSPWVLSCNRAATSHHGEGEKNKTDGLWMLLEYFSVWVWLYVSAILVLFKVTQKQAAFQKPSVTNIYLNTCKTCASSNAQKRVRNTHSESSGHVHRGGSFSRMLDMYEFLMHHWRSGAWSYF